MHVPVIFRSDRIIVNLDGTSYTRDKDDPEYDEIVQALAINDEDALREILTAEARVSETLRELEEVGIVRKAGQYYYKSEPLPPLVENYLLSAMRNDSSVVGIAMFIQRLFENPIDGTRKRLFEFMQKNKMPLTDDGCFIAYKVVRNDYRSISGGVVDNTPGRLVGPVPWSEVDTDSSVTCSRGLHVCSKEYLPHFGGYDNRENNVVAVKVPPDWVGAIPDDYNNAKIRTRGYLVLEDITDEVNAEREEHQFRAATGRLLADNSDWYQNTSRDFGSFY